MKSVFDIAFIGDSLVFKQSSGFWLDMLRADLQRQSGRPVEVYDFGVGGATATYGLGLLATPKALRPKAVVIAYGMNDAQTAAGVSVATFKTNLGAIVDAFSGVSPNRFLMTMNPAIASGNALVPSLASYYQGVRDVAAVKGVGLIDNTPSWGTPTATQIPPNGIHPTGAAAYAVMVPNIVSALLPLL